MQAVILAAGEGKRLRPVTKALPKGLIEIGGEPLLKYSLEALRKNGIKELIMVVGFKRGDVQEKFGTFYSGLKISYIFNAEYDKTGSMYSFSKAKDAIHGDIVLLESDLLYDTKFLGKLLDSKFKDCMSVAKASGSGDEVYICVDEHQRIIDLGKDIAEENKAKAIGEMVGISRFSQGFLENLFQKAEGDYAKGMLNYHYEECVFATSRLLTNPVYALLCKDLAWIEIDNNNDLKRAKEKIYPMLKRARKNG